MTPWDPHTKTPRNRIRWPPRGDLDYEIALGKVKVAPSQTHDADFEIELRIFIGPNHYVVINVIKVRRAYDAHPASPWHLQLPGSVIYMQK